MKIAVIYRELFLLLLIACCRNNPRAANVYDKSYWYDKNQNLIHNRMRNIHVDYLPRVKNVIIFIGDGMGLTTITASRTLKRQITKNPNAKLIIDEFPATAMLQTDIANSQIPESAASSTALFCGVKTNFESLGVDVTAMGRDTCSNEKSHTPSIIAWAQAKNLKTGFVTTTRATHATPAALYAHSRRQMEDDTKSESLGCKDIARQLIENETGRKLNVIMGGGMRNFVVEKADGSGRRKDGKNLTAEWINRHPNGKFFTTRDEMMEVDSNTEHVLGIFAKSHMQFNADRVKDVEPSLAEMTKKSIDLLKRNNSRGFLLVVEGGKIDLAHHYNNAYRALDDTLALDEAIQVAIGNLNLLESLIVVTSDHASAMVYSGFATPKSQSVLGMDKYVSNVDGKLYQLLTYSSGLGHNNYNETVAINDSKNAYHKATIPTTWSSHSADDVPLYAIGSMSSLLFSGTFDQTYLPHALAYAMCIFQYESRCHHNEVKFQRVRPTHEKKATGIEALKQELKKQSRNNIHTTKPPQVEQMEENTTTDGSQENFIDEGSFNETFPEPFESSDLISNLTDSSNSTCSTFYSRQSIIALSLIFTINQLAIF